MKSIESVLKAFEYTDKKLVDLVVDANQIISEESSRSSSAMHIAFRNLIDFGTKVSEPGFEHRETLEQTCKAAYFGGFTAIMPFATTDPAVDNQVSIEFLSRRNGKYDDVQILPIGAVSHGCKGEDLAFILEMNDAGAVAFSDGQFPILSGGLLMRALDYVKGIGKVIIDSPFDSAMFPNGMVDEGIVSTLMGVAGIPMPAEEIIVNRDIQLAKYTGSALHLYCISTQGSVELIREAKKQGLPVTASVSANNLLFTSDEVLDFDTNLKLMPPLRNKDTTKMLWDAVVDGTIDIITCQHMPYEVEKKDLEFQFASFGALGLQTAIGGILTKYGDEAVPIIQKAMSDRIIEIFNLQETFRNEKISIFEKKENQLFNLEKISSNCRNSPFIGRQLNYYCKAILKN